MNAKKVISFCFNKRMIFFIFVEEMTSKYSYTEISRNYNFMWDRFSLFTLSLTGLVIY